jgi:hypothetical protein
MRGTCRPGRDPGLLLRPFPLLARSCDAIPEPCRLGRLDGGRCWTSRCPNGRAWGVSDRSSDQRTLGVTAAVVKPLSTRCCGRCSARTATCCDCGPCRGKTAAGCGWHCPRRGCAVDRALWAGCPEVGRPPLGQLAGTFEPPGAGRNRTIVRNHNSSGDASRTRALGVARLLRSPKCQLNRQMTASKGPNATITAGRGRTGPNSRGGGASGRASSRGASGGGPGNPRDSSNRQREGLVG